MPPTTPTTAPRPFAVFARSPGRRWVAVASATTPEAAMGLLVSLAAKADKSMDWRVGPAGAEPGPDPVVPPPKPGPDVWADLVRPGGGS